MKRLHAGLVFIICYISYTAIYIARLNLTIASPGLIEQQVMNVSQVGILGSVFSVVYAVGRLINGMISDEKPPFVMISSGLILVSISNISFGFFPPFIGLLLLWSANAFAQSMLWSAILCIVTSIYPPEIARQKISIIVTAVAAGNILGILINTVIISNYGLPFAFILPGLFTLLCGMAVLFTARKVPYARADKAAHIPVYRLFGHRQVRTGIIPALVHGVMKDNISLWMTVYFVSQFHVNLKQSAYFVFFIPVIGFIGRILYPPLFKLCKGREHILSLFAFIVCAAAALPLCLKGVTPVVAAISLSLIYAAVSVINTTMLSVFPIHFGKTGNIASVSGIMDFSTYLGAGIGSMIYGFVIKQFGFSPMYLSWVILSLLALVFVRRLDKATRSE